MSQFAFLQAEPPTGAERKRGLDYATNQAEGAPMAELKQVLPAQPTRAIQRMLRDMLHEGRVELRGQRRAARWHLALRQPTGTGG